MSPRTFPPAPGWSPGAQRIKAPLEYSRGPDKVWVYGTLRVRDGQALTFTAPSRNTAGYRQLLDRLDRANPDGELYVISDVGTKQAAHGAVKQRDAWTFSILHCMVRRSAADWIVDDGVAAR